MKASKRLKQSIEALETRARMPVMCHRQMLGRTNVLVVEDSPAPVVYNAHKLAERLLAKLNSVPLPGDLGTRPPGCKRRGGKWVPR